jgi:hypothetical protein
MDNAEVEQRQRYPVPALSDEELLKEIFSLLSKSVNEGAPSFAESAVLVFALGAKGGSTRI